MSEDRRIRGAAQSCDEKVVREAEVFRLELTLCVDTETRRA